MIARKTAPLPPSRKNPPNPPQPQQERNIVVEQPKQETNVVGAPPPPPPPPPPPAMNVTSSNPPPPAPKPAKKPEPAQVDPRNNLLDSIRRAGVTSLKKVFKRELILKKFFMYRLIAVHPYHLHHLKRRLMIWLLLYKEL